MSAHLVQGADPALRDREVQRLVEELLAGEDRTLALEEHEIPARRRAATDDSASEPEGDGTSLEVPVFAAVVNALPALTLPVTSLWVSAPDSTIFVASTSIEAPLPVKAYRATIRVATPPVWWIVTPGNIAGWSGTRSARPAARGWTTPC